MHALHKDARFILGPDANVTKYVRLIDQFPLNDGGNLVALRHNVVGDHAIGICRVQRSMIREFFWMFGSGSFRKPASQGIYDCACRSVTSCMGASASTGAGPSSNRAKLSVGITEIAKSASLRHDCKLGRDQCQ